MYGAELRICKHTATCTGVRDLSAGGPGEQGWGMTRGRSLRLTPARQTAVQALAESVFSSVKLYQM